MPVNRNSPSRNEMAGFVKSDTVRVRLAGTRHWTEGEIRLATKNGRYLGVHVEDTSELLGGVLLGILPLIFESYDDGWLGLFGSYYELERPRKNAHG